jgi:hypothetical protein
MRVVNAEDAQVEQMIKQENLEVLHPEYKTRPRVYYKNLYRYSKCFLGGDVAFKRNGFVECAEGAKVILLKGSQRLSEALTDNYGDFKFDELKEQSGQYTLEIVFAGCQKRMIEVDLTTSTNVGTIMLNT